MAHLKTLACIVVVVATSTTLLGCTSDGETSTSPSTITKATPKPSTSSTCDVEAAAKCAESEMERVSVKLLSECLLIGIVDPTACLTKLCEDDTAACPRALAMKECSAGVLDLSTCAPQCCGETFTFHGQSREFPCPKSEDDAKKVCEDSVSIFETRLATMQTITKPNAACNPMADTCMESLKANMAGPAQEFAKCLKDGGADVETCGRALAVKACSAYALEQSSCAPQCCGETISWQGQSLEFTCPKSEDEAKDVCETMLSTLAGETMLSTLLASETMLSTLLATTLLPIPPV